MYGVRQHTESVCIFRQTYKYDLKFDLSVHADDKKKGNIYCVLCSNELIDFYLSFHVRITTVQQQISHGKCLAFNVFTQK